MCGWPRECPDFLQVKASYTFSCISIEMGIWRNLWPVIKKRYPTYIWENYGNCCYYMCAILTSVLYEVTWLVNPWPIPSKIRLRSSIGTLTAAPPNTDPTMKKVPPISIDARRSNLLVMDDATRVATRPAMYRDDVNRVRSSLLNWQ